MKYFYTMVAILCTPPVVYVLSNPVNVPVCAHLNVTGYLNVIQILDSFEDTLQEVSRLAEKLKAIEPHKRIRLVRNMCPSFGK